MRNACATANVIKPLSDSSGRCRPALDGVQLSPCSERLVDGGQINAEIVVRAAERTALWPSLRHFY